MVIVLYNLPYLIKYYFDWKRNKSSSIFNKVF